MRSEKNRLRNQRRAKRIGARTRERRQALAQRHRRAALRGSYFSVARGLGALAESSGIPARTRAIAAITRMFRSLGNAMKLSPARA